MTIQDVLKQLSLVQLEALYKELAPGALRKLVQDECCDRSTPDGDLWNILLQGGSSVCVYRNSHGSINAEWSAPNQPDIEVTATLPDSALALLAIAVEHRNDT